MSSSPATDADLQARIRRQEAVAELSQRALVEDDLDGLFADAAVAVAEAVDAEYCDLLELAPDGDGAVLRAGTGWHEGLAGAVQVPAGPESRAGRALAADGPVVDEERDDSRTPEDGLLAGHDVASGVTVCVEADGVPWGTLGVHAAEPRAFTGEEVSFVERVADVLGAAVEAADESEGPGDAPTVAESPPVAEEVYGRISDAFFAVDEDVTITYLDERAEELINPEDRQLEGENVWEAFPEGTDLAFKSAYERAMAEQETVTFEEFYEPLDAWFEVTAYPSESGLSVYLRDVSGRKEREHELQERERQLSTLVENVPGMVYRCRNERGWPMSFVSDAARELTGYEPGAFERGEVSFGDDVVVEADREELWEEVQRGLGESGSFLVTYRIETADGVIRWVRERGRGIYEDGELDVIEGVIIDVTDRTRAQRRLAEERDVFTEGPAVVFRWTPDREAGWPVEYVSENVEDVLGYEPDALESGEVPYTDLLLEADRDRVGREVEAALERGADRFAHDPYRVRTADGESRWVKDVTKIVRDADGEVDSYLGYLVDVTERKERERELRRYETIVEAVEDGVYVVDEDGHFTMVNEAYAEMTGYDREELLGEHVSSVVGDEVVERAADTETAMREGETEAPAIEAEVETASGERIPAEATFAMLPTADGEERRVGVVRDVSDRKERERELQRKERRYEAVFEDPNILVGLLDPDGTVLDINQTAMEYVDADLADVTGEPFSETPWWGDGDGVQADVREWVERAAAGEYVDFQADLTRPDGERYTLEGFFRPVTDDDGEVVSIIVSDRDVTERRERERELEESERRYRTLVENFPNGAVGLVDEDLRYRTVGGRPVDEDVEVGSDLEGERVRDVVSEELADAIEPRYRAALHGESSAFEAEHDGRHSKFHIFPVRDGDGEVFAAMGMSQDVTEQKEHERELAKFETIVETVEDGIYVKDEDGHFTMVNEAYAELTGYDRGELLGEHASIVVDEDAIDEARALETEPDAGDGDSTMEATIQRADGGTVPAEATFARLETDDEPLRVGVVRDVTERKERERQLRESEEQFRTLAEGLEQIVWMSDANTQETYYVNPAFEDVWGMSRDVLYDESQSILEAVHPEDRDRVEAAFTDPETLEYDVEYRIVRPDGDVRWIHTRAAAVRDEDGEPDRVVGIADDVTERVERERRLEESERRYRTLVESFPEGAVGLFDSSLEYTAVGGELVAEGDRSRDEFVGASVHELYPDEIIEEVEPYFQAALSGEASTFEVEYSGWHLSAHTLPVRDDDGEVFAGMLVVQDVTDRREMERELRESEARFRMLAENLEEVVWMASPDAEEFIYLNPAFEEVWGIERSELYDDMLAFLDAVHEDDREYVREQFTSLPESEFDEEFRIVRPDGEVRWVRAGGALAEDGEMARVVGIGEDVTDRVEREQELERALDLLERTETIADVGGWEIDPETTDVYWSDHIYELLGVDGDEEPSLEEALGMYHEEDLPTLEAAIEEALEEGESFDVEARIQTGDGETRWLRVQGVPEVADGEVRTLRGAAQDVTDRHQREAMLQRRSRAQTAVADLGQVALETDDLDELMHEAASRVADVLDTDYCKVLDLDPSDRELLLRQGVGWDDGIVGSATVDADASSQAGYTLESEELVVVDDLETEARFEGPELLTSHDVTSGISTIVGSTDDPWGILGTHDTGRRDFDAEDVRFVQNVANVLAEAIERRRYHLRLEELVEKLEASNERLEQFAYAASHDLQEPLRMVSSYLQLIERRYADELDEDGREFIDFAVDGADRMRDMIDGLLQYSRVETRGNPFEPVDLESVFEDARADLRMKIQETDAEIEVESLPLVQGDPGQLTQVFQNLLSNAIEYSGDEPPRIHVSAERADGEWVVSVRDRGIGMDPDQTDQIFQVFHRLHGQEEHSGTGIGLALCRRIVERHGGEIWVDTTPGEGSTVSFTLPVEETQ